MEVYSDKGKSSLKRVSGGFVAKAEGKGTDAVKFQLGLTSSKQEETF